MMFREKLEAIAEKVSGTVAASILGLDGIAIDSINPGDVALDHIAAGITSAYKSIQMTNTGIETGDLSEISVSTDRYSIYLSRIVDEHFLLVVVGSDSYQGQVRHQMKMAKHKLSGDLQ